MNVMTSVAFIRPPRGSVGQSPPPVLRNLVDRRAADGSLRMRLPEDWFTWTDFTGRNPNYPAESMREITSWELDHGSQPP